MGRSWLVAKVRQIQEHGSLMATWELANIPSLKKDNCLTNNVSSSRVKMNICFNPMVFPKQ
jgi:hypothetical protein